MPKVVVYVRADDARMIEATEHKTIDTWVRATVKDQISHWHARQMSPMADQRMPESWQNRQTELQEGA